MGNPTHLTIDPRLLAAASVRLWELSLRDFVKEAWKVVEPSTTYVDSWHVHAICEHLEACAEGEIQRLLINVPPRCMKSLLVSVFFPAWVWTTRPHTRWLFSSYAQNLSTRDSRRCRDLLMSSWYQKNWGRLFKLREDQNQKTRFDNDRTGFRLASSTGGVGTGEGGDFIVADDPHNVVDAESDLERQSVLDWWDQSMSTRGNDPKTVVHIVVMQRLHERDLSGHLLAQGGYEYLCLPMEYESERRCVTSLGWQDPRTAEGELLCQKRFGQAEVEELKRRLGTYGAAGQLQQRPAPKGGGMFRREWFQVVTHVPAECRRAVRYWDNGSTDGSGDYTVGVLMTEHKGVYYVVDVVRGQWSTGARREKQGRTAAEDRLRFPNYSVYVEQEPGSAGKDSIDDTIKYLAGYAVYGDRVTGDKITRAEPVAAQAEAGNIKLLVGPWNEPLLRELEVFPFGANDDQCDSLSGCFAKIVKKREFIFSME